jgi:hypothetical protein
VGPEPAAANLEIVERVQVTVDAAVIVLPLPPPLKGIAVVVVVGFVVVLVIVVVVAAHGTEGTLATVGIDAILGRIRIRIVIRGAIVVTDGGIDRAAAVPTSILPRKDAPGGVGVRAEHADRANATRREGGWFMLGVFYL